MTILFTDTAEQDLLETLRFYRAPSASGDSFNWIVKNVVDHLALWPYTGHRRRDLTPHDVCFWYEHPQLFAFQVANDRLTIVAVLHGSRDVARVLRKRLKPAGRGTRP